MAITAFSLGGLLSIFGDNLDNTIKVSRDASGALLINDGAIAIRGTRPSATNTSIITVASFGGNDTITLDETLGPLPRSVMFGGEGNDILRGGAGADHFFGGAGNDTIDGRGGNDTASLGLGDDIFIWNPGDGSDRVEGGGGRDSLLFNGSSANEQFDVAANGDRVRFTRDVGNIVMDLRGIEQLDLNALGGADTFTVNPLAATELRTINLSLESLVGNNTGDTSLDRLIVNGTNDAETIDVNGTGSNSYSVNGLAAIVNVNGSETTDGLLINSFGGNDTVRSTTLAATAVQFTVDGGADDDTLIGGAGVETFFGGDGNDTVDGNGGNDIAFLGAGNDLFIWDPGDGSDVVEGQAGIDEMRFNGANISEQIDIAANGGRVRFFRNIGSITMDLDDVETVSFNALGGSDAIVVNDLSGTDLTQVFLNLGTDGQADQVTVNGSNAADTIAATTTAGETVVSGLAAQVRITGVDAGQDQFTINGLGGDDQINASGLTANLFQFTVNGGLGNDVFVGSAGNDFFNGGDGTDTGLMGAGDDIFLWNPGDDSDIVEGQGGSDTLRFNGSDVAENFDVSANGDRVRLFRNVANVTMDLNDVETLELNTLGGADTVTINDLSGTDLTQVRLDLGSGDGAGDTVIVNGTAADDTIAGNSSTNQINVFGLAANITIVGAEPSPDRLIVNGLAGDDILEFSNLPAVINLTLSGGDNDDILTGGAGNDVLLGGAGDDVLVGGAGIDVLDGGLGDDVEIQ
jgi:Ca2+-binding RTX toxin-like protein